MARPQLHSLEVPALPSSLGHYHGTIGPIVTVVTSFLFSTASWAAQQGNTGVEPKPPVSGYWAVEDIKEGMRGYGKTVMHGTEIEKFEVEVLGVQRNSSPGRDTVLVRLKGCQLEHTGIIAGMSGSPVYVEGRLLGAVAFAWPFGKEPIAGVTPFSQMVSFAGNLRNEYLADSHGVQPTASLPNLKIWERDFQSILSDRKPQRAIADSGPVLGMDRIKMPVVVSGFAPQTLPMLRDTMEPLAMLPVMGGGANADVLAEAADKPLEPGSPLCVAMVTGDFDISGVGTVTHIEGDRIYGFGHPMFSLGKCEFPLMNGYIHVVYPRQTVSFKMSSPLKTIGVIDTDVSTCVAGRLGQHPHMVPMELSIKRQGQSAPHHYKVEIVPQKELFASMVFNVLVGAIDTEGNLPDELTMKVTSTIQPKGHDAIVISDMYAGDQYSGQFAPSAVYGVVPNILNILVRNPFQEVEIESIRTDTEILESRNSASIERVRLSSDLFEPGEKVVARVELDPYKGAPKTVELSLDLPGNMSPGVYQALVCDSMTSIRSELRNQPYLLQPENLEQLYRVLNLQVAERRTNLFLRVMTRDLGVALEGQAMPNLPLSMAQILTSRRRSGVLPIRTELVSKIDTPFVLQGAQALQFQVVADKKFFQKTTD
jgi:SpoIVB peptidase S55